MEAATTLINSLDLINLSRDIAQLNLGYLGISVAILGVLGGVFVYFNIKPLQEKLSKQEDLTNELRKEALNLLGESAVQTNSSLEEFEKKQTSVLAAALVHQKENSSLEMTNRIQSAESDILEKVNLSSNDKEIKLKEILLSEMSNKILSLEKTLTILVEENKKTTDERFSLFEKNINTKISKISADLLELKSYKYDMEGKMGGIIYAIEALEKCFKDEPYLLEFKLNDLKGKIGKYDLDPELFIRLKNILNNIQTKYDKHSSVIEEIKDSVNMQVKPKWD